MIPLRLLTELSQRPYWYTYATVLLALVWAPSVLKTFARIRREW